ncbi:MAG: transposase [Opitutaceae bacterium]|nr:transposase [Opitutaceae bacterium]
MRLQRTFGCVLAHLQTTKFTRGRLPHWEVERGRYFVTVRCHDSLPREVVSRLDEIQKSLQRVTASSREFLQMQRQYFRTMEKFLDAGGGSARLREPQAAAALVAQIQALSAEGIDVPHFTIMPNHWHAMLAPAGDASINLHGVMTRLKGRTARAVNLAVGRSGTLWQREWFDRWMRDDAEWVRCVDYVRQNPVKAGIVRDWRDDPWTR